MNYWRFKKSFCLLSPLLMGCTLHGSDINKKKQPNIVLILADDMGYSDIGCFGGEIETPNLDRLAHEGLRMTNFYNSARSCPSRAALLTGLYPHQTGIGDMMGNDNLPAYRGTLNSECVTLAEVLSNAGYYCMISGKWHVGMEEDAWPMKRGFAKQYCSNSTTGHYFGIAKGRTYVVEDTLLQPEGEWHKTGNTEYLPLKNEDGSQWYATDAYTDRAIGYVRELRSRDAEKPFFLYLPYTTPHWPLHAFEEDIKKYEGKYMAGWDVIRRQRYERMIRTGILPHDWKLSEQNENVKDWNSLDEAAKKHKDRVMAVYAAMIDRMDQNIGRLLRALEETGDAKNTLIIFLSDNGACHEIQRSNNSDVLPGTPESFVSYEYDWANVSNTPFKWFKHWTHEGGTSTPFIAWYPGMIKAGSVNTQPAHIIDIMPTMVEIAGTWYPETYKGCPILPPEGESLISVFQGKDQKSDRTFFWEHQGNRAIRAGNMKLVSRYDYAKQEPLPWELYDMTRDRSETNDLASKNPEKVKEMEMLYAAWAEKVKVVPYKELLLHRAKKR